MLNIILQHLDPLFAYSDQKYHFVPDSTRWEMIFD